MTPEAIALLPDVLGPTPIPGLGPGLGSMPRFRAEVGPFIGFVGSGDFRAISGGYDPSVTPTAGSAAPTCRCVRAWAWTA